MLGARWCEVCVAVVGTGAAGVKESLLRSGSSRDLRLRGEPDLPFCPLGEVGLEFWGEICGGREGSGIRRLGCLAVLGGRGEPCCAEGVFPMVIDWMEREGAS